MAGCPQDSPSAEMGRYLYRLGQILRILADYDQAQLHLEKALTLQKSVIGADHPETIYTLHELGVLYRCRGDYVNAKTYLERGCRFWRDAPNEPALAHSLQELGLLYQAQGEYSQALDYLTQTVDLSRRLLGNTHPDTADSLDKLAGQLHLQGQFDAAQTY